MRNEFSGSAHNVVQAGRVENVRVSFAGSPAGARQIVVRPIPRESQHFRRDSIDHRIGVLHGTCKARPAREDLDPLGCASHGLVDHRVGGQGFDVGAQRVIRA
ncbi:hypothetical protein [Actinokineospora sp. UTMC 2448]|uniref:hypothetical protein n=1 Tax=Actinokineospora sp. UTMC 2448 TaxID=2268449 RepID=UPI002164D449|nr:hypothetical protein [Actinokineospora sp. UTMC 2448]